MERTRLITTLFFVSVVGGLCAGILGLGGAVILIPMMLAVPPLLGVGALTMKEVAGISMVQVLASSLSGCLAHSRSGHVHPRLLLAIGLPMAAASLGGAFLSAYIPSRAILTLFGVLVSAAFALLVFRRAPSRLDMADETVPFNPFASVAVGAFVGVVSGIVGAGGGFMLVPLMISVLGIPVRTTVGSSLGIVFLGAVMGSIGKMLSAQVQWIYLLPVLLGSVPAAQVGARLSRRLPPERIRQMLVGVIFLSVVRTWWDVIHAWLPR